MSGGFYSLEEQQAALAEAQAADRRAHAHELLPYQVRVLALSRRAVLCRLEAPPVEVPPEKWETWLPYSAIRVESTLRVDPERAVLIECKRWVAAARGWTADAGVGR